MSAEDQIKEEIGTLKSEITRPRLRAAPTFTPMNGDPEARILALEDDIQRLYNALLLAGRQIDHLASKISGS